MKKLLVILMALILPGGFLIALYLFKDERESLMMALNNVKNFIVVVKSKLTNAFDFEGAETICQTK